MSVIADNIDLTAAAERRTWWQRLLGRQPAGVVGTIAAAEQRAGAHLDRHSVWLHNSVRGAIGLAARGPRRRGAGRAALVLGRARHLVGAALERAEHRPERAARAGRNRRRIRRRRPDRLRRSAPTRPCSGCCCRSPSCSPGLAPAAFSFAAGQAGFTVTVVILFNIIAAERLEGRAGPGRGRRDRLRGQPGRRACCSGRAAPASALGEALAEAYSASAGYLRSAVEFGSVRCDGRLAPVPRPEDESQLAAAAARRLDDAFREFLAERGSQAPATWPTSPR